MSEPVDGVAAVEIENNESQLCLDSQTLTKKTLLKGGGGGGELHIHLWLVHWGGIIYFRGERGTILEERVTPTSL